MMDLIRVILGGELSIPSSQIVPSYVAAKSENIPVVALIIRCS